MNRRIRTIFAPSLLLAGSLAAAPAGSAQTVVLDEGAFRLFVGGEEAGRETFSIRRNGTGAGAVIIAQGRIVRQDAGGEERTTSLELTGPALRLTGYQVNVEGPESRRLAARMIGGRLSAKIVSPRGEMMREYLVAEGAVLVDDDVAHHYHFLVRDAGGEAFEVPVVFPRQNRQVMTRVTPRGTESLEVGGRTVSARRYSIQPAGGAVRHVWVDASGRVLRLEIPDQRLRAERVAPPG